MSKSVWTVAKLNLKNIKVAYAVTVGFLVVMFIQDMIKIALVSNRFGDPEQMVISSGNYIWLLIPLAAILIASNNFKKIVNLGGKRRSFFMGSLITYLVLALVVSLLSMVIYYTYDQFVVGTDAFNGVVNLVDIWGWIEHGSIIAYFQQVAFLFLVAVFFHTMTLLQDRWYGWVVDIVLTAILAVFLPIEPLRMFLYDFFRLMLFHPNAWIQIGICVVLAIIIYATSYPVLNKKRI